MRTTQLAWYPGARPGSWVCIAGTQTRQEQATLVYRATLHGIMIPTSVEVSSAQFHAHVQLIY